MSFFFFSNFPVIFLLANEYNSKRKDRLVGREFATPLKYQRTICKILSPALEICVKIFIII